MAPEYYYIVSAVGISMTIIGSILGAVLWLNKREKSINEHSDAQFANVQHDIHKLELTIAKSESSNLNGEDGIRRELGEQGHALRTKIHDLELHVRDHFVSKQTFDAALGRLEYTVENGFKEMKTTMEKAIERIERRVDKD